MAHGHLLGMGGTTLVDPAFEGNKTDTNPHGQRLLQSNATRNSLPGRRRSNHRGCCKGQIELKDRSNTLALASLNAITYAF